MLPDFCTLRMFSVVQALMRSSLIFYVTECSLGQKFHVIAETLLQANYSNKLSRSM